MNQRIKSIESWMCVYHNVLKQEWQSVQFKSYIVIVIFLWSKHLLSLDLKLDNEITYILKENIPNNLTTNLLITFQYFQILNTYLLIDFSSAGSVDLMTGSGRYSNWRLLSTTVLESKVTFTLYFPVSVALLGLQVMFPLTDNPLIL